MKKVVLFGAGASHGSGDAHPYQTPLGVDLFQELSTYFPLTWGRLPKRLADLFEINFEDAMDKFIHSGKFSTNIPTLMQNMAEYFVDFKPSNDSNLYIKFLKDLKGLLDNISFSTLNYDLLFEHAAEKNGIGVSCFYPENDKIFLLKIHGSSNFIPMYNIKFINVEYEGTINLADLELKPMDADEIHRFCHEQNNSLYPSMCLIAPQKRVQIGSSEIERLQQIWKNHISQADRILTIGFKPLKNDLHIYQPLSETNAFIGYIGSKCFYDKWTASDRDSSNTRYLGQKWNDVFDLSINFLKEK